MRTQEKIVCIKNMYYKLWQMIYQRENISQQELNCVEISTDRVHVILIVRTGLLFIELNTIYVNYIVCNIRFFLICC